MKGMPNKEQACCTKCAIFGRNNEPPHAYDVPAGCSHIHCSCHKSSCGGTTHFVCAEKLAEDGGKAVCCGCTGHECLSLPEQKDKNGHKIGADGKLVFDALCQGCDAPEQKKCEGMCCRVDDKGFHYHTCSYAAESGECIYCGRQLYKAPEQGGWEERFNFLSRGKGVYLFDEDIEITEKVKEFIRSEITKAEQAAVALERERIWQWAVNNGITDKQSFAALRDFISALSNTDK